MWLLTYVGALFNGLTLLLMGKGRQVCSVSLLVSGVSSKLGSENSAVLLNCLTTLIFRLPNC